MEFQQFRIVAADNERLPLPGNPRVSQVRTDLFHTGISLREAMELHNWWLFDEPFKKTKMSFAGSKTIPLTLAEPEFNYDVRTEFTSLGQTPKSTTMLGQSPLHLGRTRIQPRCQDKVRFNA